MAGFADFDLATDREDKRILHWGATQQLFQVAMLCSSRGAASTRREIQRPDAMLCSSRGAPATRLDPMRRVAATRRGE